MANTVSRIVLTAARAHAQIYGTHASRFMKHVVCTNCDCSYMTAQAQSGQASAVRYSPFAQFSRDVMQIALANTVVSDI